MRTLKSRILKARSLNKFNKFIKVQKNSKPDLIKNNVVYKIMCNDCDASYNMLDKRTDNLKPELKPEHRNHIR